MDGFSGEMLLDVEKRATDSLRPLNINISPPERNVSGTFFNFHDYKPTFKLDTSEQGRVTLTGGALLAAYIMDQFHFHVYCTREEAEENTLDRVQVPGEVSEKMSECDFLRLTRGTRQGKKELKGEPWVVIVKVLCKD